MDLQMKGFLIIMLLAGSEASRVKHKVDTNRLVQRVDKQRSGVQSESQSWGCDVDVMVKQHVKDKDSTLAVRVAKEAFHPGIPITVGKKLKNGCEVVYSLLCFDEKMTLRKATAPCDTKQAEIEDKNFNVIVRWRKTEKHWWDDESDFAFDPAFNAQFADGALTDSDKVEFTPTFETCEEALGQIQLHQGTVADSLENLMAAKDKAEFSKKSKMLRPYQQAKMLYDKMGCEDSGLPAVPEGFESTMETKLREAFISAGGDAEADAVRFDAMMKYLKEHKEHMSVQDAIMASGLAFGTEQAVMETVDVDEEELDGMDTDSDLDDSETEEELEQYLFKSAHPTGPSALVQVQQGQVAADDLKRIAQVAVVVVALAIICYLVFWVFIIAVVVSLGVLSYKKVRKMLQKSKIARSIARHL